MKVKQEKQMPLECKGKDTLEDIIYDEFCFGFSRLLAFNRRKGSRLKNTSYCRSISHRARYGYTLDLASRYKK